MSGFTADWLALRAEADARARNRKVAAALSAAFAERPGARVLDIGAGTGANMRATAPLLPRPQRWTLVDHDAALLARAAAQGGLTVETRVADLAGGIAIDADLVTASAFFDLAGAAWMDGFVAALAAAGAALFAVLSYDGRERWAGSHPLDRAVHAAFLADQHRDKGLGPALGPEGHAALAGKLRAAGYRVVEGASDWQLEAGRDGALIRALAEGVASAAEGVEGVDDWLRARRSAKSVAIGHQDLLALPPSNEI